MCVKQYSFRLNDWTNEGLTKGREQSSAEQQQQTGSHMHMHTLLWAILTKHVDCLRLRPPKTQTQPNPTRTQTHLWNQLDTNEVDKSPLAYFLVQKFVEIEIGIAN